MDIENPDLADFTHRVLQLVEPRKRVAFELLFDLPPGYVIGEITDGEQVDDTGDYASIRAATVLDFMAALKQDRITPDQLIQYLHDRRLTRPIAEDV